MNPNARWSQRFGNSCFRAPEAVWIQKFDRMSLRMNKKGVGLSAVPGRGVDLCSTAGSQNTRAKPKKEKAKKARPIKVTKNAKKTKKTDKVKRTKKAKKAHAGRQNIRSPRVTKGPPGTRGSQFVVI